jgi:hypothetical protein
MEGNSQSVNAAAGAGVARVNRRQLERMLSWTVCERLRCLWYGLRLAQSDIDYAFHRMNELNKRVS